MFIEFRILIFLLNKDYLFEFNHVNIYTYIININIFFVCFKNDFDVSIIVFRHVNLDIIIEYKIDFCYTTYPENHGLIIEKREIKIYILKKKSKLN